MKTGLYKITAPNGHFYIGSTTRSFKKRWAEHRTELRNKKHHNSILQAAWEKYGESNMIFSIILFCAPNDCADYEQRALKYLPHSYNLSVDVSSPFRGRKHSEKAKEKCRLIHLGKKKAPKTKEHSNNQSAAQMGRKVKKETTEKTIATKKAKGIERGSYFSISGLENIRRAQKKVAESLRGKSRIFSSEHCKALSDCRIGKFKGADNPAARKVICVEENKEFATVKDAQDWIREIKKPTACSSNISSCCTGNLKTAYGYHWKYA